MADPQPRSSERRFYGTAVSRGIGVGRAVVLTGNTPVQFDPIEITPVEAKKELQRFRNAFGETAADLARLAEDDATGVFGVHRLILEDAFASVGDTIAKDLIPAEKAVRTIARALAERQRAVNDTHIREKYLDIYDVADRLIRSINGSEAEGRTRTGAVYVVSDLTPSRLTELLAHHPQAVIAEHGGWTSHTSILAREHKLPAVTGVRGFCEVIRDGDLVLVDGNSGSIIVEPTHETISTVTNSSVSLRSTAIGHDSDLETETADGTSILVRVNANLPDIYDRARRAGAFGIGLYRSEVLFDRADRFPAEEEQFEAYREIAAGVGAAGVRIRTFDVGIDRLTGDPRHGQPNPALGLRAVRLSLSDKEYFRTQVRAILRASYEGNVEIVLPMVSGVADVLELRRLIDEVHAGLAAPTGMPRIGAMIETPSAVMTVEDIAEVVDFLCLGTNDLVQYLLAVGRDDPSVAEWYQTLHPAVLSSIKRVVAAGSATGKPVAVCGEMAGSAFYAPLLLGLGARELSMNVNSVSQVRAVIADIDLDRCEELAARALERKTSDSTDKLLREYYAEHWPFILARHDSPPEK